MWKAVRTFIALSLWLTAGQAVAADVQLNPLFSDGVVLQQGTKVPIWGKAGKADKVTVTFRNQILSATADENGAWRVDLAPLESGGPWPLTVEGKNKIELKSVYVGEVWLCSGQSNMVLELEKTTDGKDAAAFTSDQLRLFVNGKWVSAGPEVNPKFSAVALHFGKTLQAARKQPVGLIVRAVGATSAEQWTPLPVLQRLELSGGELFEQHIKPLIPFAIKGVVWYQGEWNVDRHRAYAGLMAAMISAWRERWGQGDFPFVIVQLPRSGSGPAVKWPSPKSPQPADTWAHLRQAQVGITSLVPNTALVVSFDDSDGDLHPKTKRILGERCALAARGLAYGEKIPCYSPLLDTVTRTGDKITLKFKHAEAGLKIAGDMNGTIPDLHLLTQDGKAKPASAKIEGDSLIIDAAGQTAPFDIYYAWSAWPNGNLFSNADLPISPFRYEALRLRVISCDGKTLTLAANKPLLSAEAVKTASYAISGSTISTVALSPDKTRITLTAAAPFPLDQPLTITAAGLQGESATGAVPELKASRLPGLVCNGEPIEEILLGEPRDKIDPAHILEQETIDPQSKPAAGEKWAVVRSAEPFDLSRTFGGKKDQLIHACFYIHSTADQSLQLLAASEDTGLKVLVNGKAILTNPNAHGLHWGAPDKMNNIAINKGWNTVLVALVPRGGRPAFTLRILGTDGKPPTGVTYRANGPGGQ